MKTRAVIGLASACFIAVPTESHSRGGGDSGRDATCPPIARTGRSATRTTITGPATAMEESPIGGRAIGGSPPLTSIWKGKFTEPVLLRDGRSIATLSQARDLILHLTEAQQERPFWAYAAKLLLAAAESGEAADIRDAAHQLLRALTSENMQSRVVGSTRVPPDRR